MPQVKVRFYLPLRDNDGRELKAEIDEVETNLVVLFGGWTLTSVVKGAYLMADKTPVHDESNAYEVVMNESRVPEVRSLLLAFKGKTTQEAIYLEIQPSNVEFL